MAYTPPAGNAVNFTFDGKSYSPPAGDGVNFDFATSTDLFCLGSVRIDGRADINSGTGVTGIGGFSLSGVANIETSEPLLLVCDGRVELSGVAVLTRGSRFSCAGNIELGGTAALSATRTFTLRLSGRAAVVGTARVNADSSLFCRGKVEVNGQARVLTWRTLSVSGSVVINNGRVTLRRGASLFAGGSVRCSGASMLSTQPAFDLVCLGAASVRGRAVISKQSPPPLPSLAVRTCHAEVIYVME